MRKLFLAAFAVFAFASVNAQTEKGNWVIGGNSSISFASTTATVEFEGTQVGEDLKTSVFTVTPSVGYFVMDNLSVGLDLGFTSTKIEDATTSAMSAVPVGTYYFEAGDNLKPFVGLGAGFISTSSGDDDALKSSGLALRGSAGLAYFINESISINFVAQYLNTNQKNKADNNIETKNSSIGLGVGFSLFL